MAGINKAILVGNVGKDPEIRAIENGKKVANFPLATSESYKDKNGEKVENTEWHNIVFWGPVVDVIDKYVKKGSQIYIEGKIRTRSYEKEGVKRYVTEILGDTLNLLSSSKNDNASNQYNQSASKSSNTEYSNKDFEANDVDDLPF